MKNKKLNSAIRLAESLENISETYDLFILFIDLCDSTEIKQHCYEQQIPDHTWIMRTIVFLSRTARIIQQYSGSIVKTIGDEVMATFPFNTNPVDIIRCILEIFQTFDNLKSYKTGKFKIYSKASIDFGTCFDGQLIYSGVIDPIGTCVDRCARLGKYVSKNEIIISEEFYELLLEKNYKFDSFQIHHGKDELKGLGLVKYYKLSTDNS